MPAIRLISTCTLSSTDGGVPAVSVSREPVAISTGTGCSLGLRYLLPQLRSVVGIIPEKVILLLITHSPSCNLLIYLSQKKK